MVGPHAGEAVGLQLDAYLGCIALARAHALLRLLHLRQNAEEVLHVMPDLVGDDVGLRELASLAAAAAEAVLQIVEERSVEINALILRAVEWSHGGLRETAARPRRAPEEHEPLGLVVAVELLPGDVRPAVL